MAQGGSRRRDFSDDKLVFPQLTPESVYKPTERPKVPVLPHAVCRRPTASLASSSTARHHASLPRHRRQGIWATSWSRRKRCCGVAFIVSAAHHPARGGS
jgi:hypothetical protein